MLVNQMSFLTSSGIGFFSAGYFIGFRSPGKTIIETGVGGLLGFCLVIGIRRIIGWVYEDAVVT